MNPRFRTIAALALSALLVSLPLAGTPFPEHTAVAAAALATSLQSVQSYTIYYGMPTPAAIAELTSYQMVVIEPRLWTLTQVRQLTDRGIKVLGYLSVLEQYSGSYLIPKLGPSDYLLVDGVRHYRSEWDSWSMNINSSHYRKLLMQDYSAQIDKKGLTGVFLDTMGNSDDGIWSDAVADRQRDGSVSFVAALRFAYPNRVIVQNWGLGALKDRTAPYIDGILWEDFDPNIVSEDEWSWNRMSELDALRASSGLSVFTVNVGLDGQEADAYYSYNRSLGYVGQVISYSYDEL